MTQNAIDYERLLKLRLVVARVGEMDLARWWNTQGLLGTRGKVVLARGFPHTHCFAQARVVFTVARARCHELFDPPGCATLWSLPAKVEDQFEEHWQDWLDDMEKWTPFFERLMTVNDADLLGVLRSFGLVNNEQADAASRLRRAAENRAVPLPGTRRLDDETLTLLAVGFSRGESGSPAIPYARLED